MKKIISLIICIAILVTALSLSSCGTKLWGDKSIFPEGYTGGFEIPYGSGLQIFWVETYEEAVDAMNQLKSHGSTFANCAIFSYEGDLFDTKYCFEFGEHKDSIKYGDNPYDRWAKNVYVISCGFFEDVTIDELVYSDINYYDTVSFSVTLEFDKMDSYSNIDLNSLTYVPGEEKNGGNLYYNFYYYKINLFSFGRIKKGQTIELSDECVDAIINSIVLIGCDY